MFDSLAVFMGTESHKVVHGVKGVFSSCDSVKNFAAGVPEKLRDHKICQRTRLINPNYSKQ
jgi:hypothetical protein